MATALGVFAVLVLLPSAVAGFVPPPGTEILWRIGAPLAVVLSPTAAAFAALLASPTGQAALSWWQDQQHGVT